MGVRMEPNAMTMHRDGNASCLSVLIVDDEVNIRKTLSYCLAAEGHTVIAVSNPADAVDEARRRAFDLAFVDLRLGEENGMDLIPVLAAESPWTKIVVITAHASIESVVEAMRRGAADYIAKPFTPDQVRLITRRIAGIRALETEVAALREDIQRLGPEDRLQTANAGMQRVIETARKAAPSEAVILLTGESGTGKSVFARAIHHWSARAAKPMAVVACPAVPADLLESELFGHAKGAFTGAVRDVPGRIAACEGGTLFLDEIGGHGPFGPGQAAALYPGQGIRTYRRTFDKESGCAHPRGHQRRSRAAGGRGRFREDLFYRLNVIRLTIPPLRERPEDILPLARGFLAHFGRANHKAILGFTAEAEASLTRHAWPGNVRELRNAVERAAILGSGQWIGKADLPGDIVPAPGSPAIGDRVPLSAIEELHIRRVMANTASLQEAADVLGIDQATLWRRRKTYGI